MPTTLLEVLIYVAAIITLVKFLIFNFKFLFKLKFLIFKQTTILIPIILFVMAGIVSVIIAPDKREALGLFKAYIFDPILFFWVIVTNFQIKNSIKISNFKFKIILNALILSGFFVALQAIWQKITGQVAADGRVLGVFGYSPNYLALYLAHLAFLAFGFVIEMKNIYSNKIRLWQISYFIAFLVMLLAIWFSGSRGALAATLVSISIFFAIKYWRIIKTSITLKILLYCYIVILLVGGWQIIKPNWTLSPDSGRISTSNNIRWEIYKTTTKDILPVNNQWLWGVGLGNYQNYFSEITQERVNFPEWISPMALTPHNIFLTIWVNLGLLGLIAFVWLICLFFQFSAFSFQSSVGKNTNSYSLLLISVMIAILIQGLA
ncbi:MAG: O-antigen ligase family protein, partial [Patescibacteria group bacterium]|nr:O-antigen ligase family protein [Patescibacteria group bacterium]